MQKENKSKHCSLPDGKKLNILAAAFANVISDNFNNEELEVLSLFFSSVSNSLTTIAAANVAAANKNDGSSPIGVII